GDPQQRQHEDPGQLPEDRAVQDAPEHTAPLWESEIPNPKSETNPKPESRNAKPEPRNLCFELWISVLGFVWDFGFGISDFRTQALGYPRPGAGSDLSLSSSFAAGLPITRSRIWSNGSSSAGTGFLWNLTSAALPVTLPRTSIFSRFLLTAGGIER